MEIPSDDDFRYIFSEYNFNQYIVILLKIQSEKCTYEISTSSAHSLPFTQIKTIIDSIYAKLYKQGK